MGIGDLFHGQFVDIVEWVDNTRDTIAYKFARQDNEIKNGARLVVREGQVAVFENEGQIADQFGPGTYQLETANLPVLADLKGWKYDFRSPFKAEVFFFSTRQLTDFRWGTQNPLMLRDPEFGPIRLRAFGTYALQVTDPAALLRQLVGSDPDFSADEIAEYLRQTVVSELGPALAASKVAALDLAANENQIAGQLATTLTAQLTDYGLAVTRFVIENISFPPEVEAALDKRTSMAVIGNANLGAYTQYEAATAVGSPAAGGGAGSVIGLGAGVASGQQLAGQLAPQQGAPAPAAAAPAGPAVPPPLPGGFAPVHVAIDGAQAGPFGASEVTAQIAAGRITRDSLVWRPGLAAWTPAAQVPDVAALFAAVPPPLPPVPPAPAS
jgi:membrane protease subunit (stomatin/prohibitin family)